jgi:hypothetical protein
VSYNSATDGGGIYNLDGTVTVSVCTRAGNSVTGFNNGGSHFPCEPAPVGHPCGAFCRDRAGHTPPDAAQLAAQARERLKAAEDFWRNDDYRNTYWEVDRALRPLRILMRAE